MKGYKFMVVETEKEAKEICKNINSQYTYAMYKTHPCHYTESMGIFMVWIYW